MIAKLSRMTGFLVCLAAAVPVEAQQKDAEKPYLAMFLTGEQGRARAGVVVAANSSEGRSSIQDDTVLVSPRGARTDLATFNGFQQSSGAKFVFVTPDGTLEKASIGKQISGYSNFSIKINRRTPLISGNSKAGEITTKIEVFGWVGLTSEGAVLLPLEGVYNAAGNIISSFKAEKRTENTIIIGAVLGMLDGRLTLGLKGLAGGIYALPGFAEATGLDTYPGPLVPVSNFGFSKLAKSGATSANAASSRGTKNGPGLAWRFEGHSPESLAALKGSNAEASAYIASGDAKFTSGDMAGALADYNRAVQAAPGLQDACLYSNLGSAKGSAGDLAGAVADSTKAIDLNGCLVSAYDIRGSARQAMNDMEGAIADFTEELLHAKSEAVSGNDVRFASVHLAVNYYLRGYGRARKGDLDGAIADWNTAIQLYPEYAEAYYSLGSAKQNKGDLEGAKADRAKALQLKPEHPRQ